MFTKSFYRRALLVTLSILLTAFALLHLSNNDQAHAQSNPGDVYILAPSTRTLSPVSVYRTVGTVTNANANPTAASPTRISGTGSYITVDFNKEVGGLITLNFAGASTANQSVGLAFSESSTYVGITSDESANCCGRSDGALLTTVSGAGSYTMPTSSLRGGFRYLTIFMNSSGWVDLSGISLNYTVDPAMSNPHSYPNYFYSNDDLLNKIWYAGAYTVQTNTIGSNQGRIWPPPASGWNNGQTVGVGATVLVDGAKRDRTVWPGDMGIAVTTAYVSTSDMQSTKNSLQTLYNTQKSTGELPYSGPMFSFFGSDTYHMWTLVGTWNYYLYSGDRAWLSSIWSQYKLGVSFITAKIDANGLLNVTGTLDWARNDQGGENIEANAILYHVLVTGANLADAMSDSATAASYRSQAANLKTQINARLWGGNLYNDNPGTTMQPQDGNALAIWFDVVDSPSKATTISNTLSTRWNFYGGQTPEWNNDVHPYSGGMEVYAHFRSGQDERGLNLIRRTWGYMLNSPIGTNSTFWEGINKNGGFGYTDYFMSLSHGWSSAPTGALTTYVLGVDTDTPTGGTYHVIPHTGDLTHVEGKLSMTASKSLSVSYDRACGSFSMQVNATSNTGSTGVIGIPRFGQTITIQIGGATAWNGTSFTGSTGIASADQDANYVYFRGVQPGTRTFSDTYSCIQPTSTPQPTATAIPPSGPAGYTFCAYENGVCTFSGTASVAYGANGAFNYQTVTNGIACNNNAFGDPISGTAKACYYKLTITPTPTFVPQGGPGGYTLCASENSTCSFSGTATVAYGANGTFYFKVATNSIGCNNTTFGDPILNVAKSCYYLLSGSAPPGYTYCIGEGGTCSFVGTATVAFGANGTFYFATATNSIACNTATFGDPIYGVAKSCYILPRGTGPAGYTFCMGEGGTCSFAGTASVAYGANGAFNFKTATTSIACNNATFGDPISGVAKSCYYQITAAPTATSNAVAAWQAGVAYTVGQLVTYGGHTYKCLQSHTSQVGWEPPNAPSLWTLVS